MKASSEFGLVTVDRHIELRKKGIYLRVKLNGEDVTDRCRAANDIEGWAELLRHSANGNAMLTATGELFTETIHGEVIFEATDEDADTILNQE